MAKETITFTKEQELAIGAGGTHVLVSASAGTGKTAVLVERVIRMVTRPQDPVDLERILVLTFTEKAAEEMKGRIRKALEAKVRESPGDDKVLRQLSSVERAQISTVHAFCLRMLKRYFYRVDLDPAFGVLDAGEAELLRGEALEELFEDAYKSGGQLFRDLVDRYGGYRVDEGLGEICLGVHDFATTQPSFSDYLADLRRELSLLRETPSLWALPQTRGLLQQASRTLDSCITLCEHALVLCRDPVGPAPYIPALQDDLKLCLRLREVLSSLPHLEGGQEQVLQEVLGFEFPRLSSVRQGACDDALKKKVQSIRKAVKDRVTKIRGYAFARPPEDVLTELRETSLYMDALLDLVHRLDERYTQKKKERGALDFSDLERYFLEVLEGDGGLIAQEIRKEFDHVLMDEYQDTNPAQERIVSLCSRDAPGNRFMVGDIKQSIYRFRLAQPGIFLSKLTSYTPLRPGASFSGDGEGVRVDLSGNFRSHSQVIHGVNFLFQSIMRKEEAEIDYDEGHLLKPSANYPDGRGFGPELHLIERDGDPSDPVDEYEALEREALVVASRIKEMVNPGDPLLIWDRGGRIFRPCTYKDVSILLRATKQRADVVLEILRQCGIPAYADASTGYFQAREVEVALSLLSVIDNPRQDIPLASVLRSPVVGLSPKDLATIRANSRGTDFYDATVAFEAGGGGPVAVSLRSFFTRLERWRTLARRLPLEVVLWEILRDTGYYDYVGGLLGGTQRQANLRALCEKARQFDGFGYRGLFRFLRFVEKLQESTGDLGSARGLGESEDVVRISSVHKAKGLEFPVVFVIDLGKRFNLASSRGDVLFHQDLGIGAVYYDLSRKVKYPSLAHQAISEKIKEESIAEEMRVLYVALTRAEQKLVLVGSVKDTQRHIDEWREDLQLPGGALTYLDWIGPVLLREDSPFTVTLWGGETKIPVPSPPGATTGWEHLRDLKPPLPMNQEVFEEIRRRLEWTYPWPAATRTPGKMSVGEAKRRFQEDGEEGLPFPVDGVSGDLRAAAARGSAIHCFLAAMDLQAKDAKAEFERLCRRGFLRPRDISHEDLGHIASFLDSPLGQRMKGKPHRVRREVPFTLKVPSGLLHPGENLEGEFTVVQGIIDALIFEDDGVVLVDYKSDRVPLQKVADAAWRYTPQVSLYALACQAILRRKVKEASIAFLVPGLEFPVPFQEYLKSKGLGQ